MNQALETIQSRRSVRRYLDKPISKDILKQLIDAGRLAPTARNDQPWEFVVVTERELLQRVGGVTDYGKFIHNAAACIVVCCQETKYFLEDGSAATENIILAAESFGIGSCWVAGHKKAYCAEVKKILNIPDSLIVISLISLGYPDPLEKISRQKKGLDDIIHWEKY